MSDEHQQTIHTHELLEFVLDVYHRLQRLREFELTPLRIEMGGDLHRMMHEPREVWGVPVVVVKPRHYFHIAYEEWMHEPPPAANAEDARW